MADYCSVCSKKLGLFDKKYDILDERGNLVKCCKDCKIAHEEEVRKKTEHDEANKKVEKEIIPLYKTIPKRLGKNPTTREVIEEFMNRLLFDHSTPVINIMRISRLLSKFKIKEDEKTIGKIVQKISEEVELEEFEEELM